VNQESFHTVSGKSKSLFKDRGSKFFGFVVPVETEQEVRHQLQELKKEYHDARHHCYAFVLGAKGETYRSSDDGEPSHSAGDPILGQIRSFGLTNCLVMVIRYFGGTKLGVPGLIHAYKTAAKEALEANSRVKKYVTVDIILNFEYAQMNDVLRLVKSMNLEMVEQDFDLQCRLKLAVRTSKVDPFISKLESLENISVHRAS
jgi:uncharacterized YigZ family protein